MRRQLPQSQAAAHLESSRVLTISTQAVGPSRRADGCQNFPRFWQGSLVAGAGRAAQQLRRTFQRKFFWLSASFRGLTIDREGLPILTSSVYRWYLAPRVRATLVRWTHRCLAATSGCGNLLQRLYVISRLVIDASDACQQVSPKLCPLHIKSMP